MLLRCPFRTLQRIVRYRSFYLRVSAPSAAPAGALPASSSMHSIAAQHQAVYKTCCLHGSIRPGRWQGASPFPPADMDAIGAASCTKKNVFPQAVRAHITRPYVSGHLRMILFLEYDSMIPDILSDRSERMSAKKGSAAARFQPKLHTVSANEPQLAPFGRSDTASRLHAETVPSFPLRGRPPTERAGSCTSAGRTSYMQCGLHFRCGRFSSMDADPHPNKIFLRWRCGPT